MSTTAEHTVPEMVLLKWGQNIQARRTAKGKSQAELAAGVPTDQGTISRIERGKYLRMTPELIVRLAVALDCEPAELCPWPLGIGEIARYRAERGAA